MNMSALEMPKGFRLERGLLWPAADEHCSKVVFKMADDLEFVMKYCQPKSETPTGPQRRVAIQAGGNCGVWPRELAKSFDTVYTAEPNPSNFAALVFNTIGLPNVVKMQCAFGYKRELIKTELPDHETNNCGAFYVEAGGVVPTIRIDDLALNNVDLIYLDIEGAEMLALRGAEETIRRNRPLIVIEDKGLSERFGFAQGRAEEWLTEAFEYVVLKRIHRDVILGYAADFVDIG
jgi:FkbM family methyltransferase